MSTVIERPKANSALEDLRAFYEDVRSHVQSLPQGEPANTGKTVDDLVARAAKFATEGTILNVVSKARAD